MSLEKAIASGKEHRKRYYRSERFDPTCRPHGKCPWCEGRRLNKKRFADKMAREEIRHFETQEEWEATLSPELLERFKEQERALIEIQKNPSLTEMEQWKKDNEY